MASPLGFMQQAPLGSEEGSGYKVRVPTLGSRAAQARAIPSYRLQELKVSQRGSSPGGRRNELCPDLCSAFKPPLYFAGARASCGKQVPFF